MLKNSSCRIIKPETGQELITELQSGLSSSEICTLVGILNHNDTPVRIWRKKTGEIPFGIPQRSEFLPFVSNLFSVRTGIRVEPFFTERMVCVAEVKPWFRFMPDALCCLSDAEGEDGMPVIPLLCFISSEKVVDGDIPVGWLISAHYQMRVMGVRKAFVAWIESNGGISFDYKEIVFNNTFWAPIENAADTFWNEHVVTRRCPDVVISNEDASRVWNVASDSLSVTADDQALAAWSRILEIKSQEKAMKEEMDGLMLLIRQKMKEADTLLGESNEPIATWKNVSTGCIFQLERFRSEHPELYNLYLSPDSQSRRLLLKGLKRSKNAA